MFFGEYSIIFGEKDFDVGYLLRLVAEKIFGLYRIILGEKDFDVGYLSYLVAKKIYVIQKEPFKRNNFYPKPPQ